MPPGVASGPASGGRQGTAACLLRLRTGAAALLRALPRHWDPPAPTNPRTNLRAPAPHPPAATGARGRVACPGGHRSTSPGLAQPLGTTHVPQVPLFPLLTQG